MGGQVRAEAADLLWEVCQGLFHAVRRRLEPQLHAMGLGSVAHMAMLGVLCAQGPCRQVDLAALLHLPPSTLSESADRLVADGLLTRQPHPDDRRSQVLAVTPRGRQVLQEMKATARDHLAELLGGLDDAPARALLPALRQLVALMGVAEPAVRAAPRARPGGG